MTELGYSIGNVRPLFVQIGTPAVGITAFAMAVDAFFAAVWVLKNKLGMLPPSPHIFWCRAFEVFCRALIGNWVRRHRNSCRNSLVRLAITLSASLAIVGQSLSQERCDHRDGYPGLWKGQRFAGMFRMALESPDYQSATSVQQHLIFSDTWARLVSSELSTKSRGLCGAFITSYAFPDLRVFLTVSGSSRQFDEQKDLCRRTLQDILLHSESNSDSISRAALDNMRFRSLQPSDDPAGHIIEAHKILELALERIYENGSLLHSLILVSIDPTGFRSIDVTAFQRWVLRAQTGGRLTLIQVSHCRSRDDDEPSEVLAKANYYSGIARSGTIQLSQRPTEAFFPGVLRRAVIVRNSDSPRASRVPSAATIKYCNKDHHFVLGDNSVLQATIRCVGRSIHELDSWTVFFCDPRVCSSSQKEQAVMAAVAGDPEVMAHASGNPKRQHSSGPYLIAVERDKEK